MDKNEIPWIMQNRRRFDRKAVDLSACIGDPRWQRSDFEVITVLDISIGGIRFTVPKSAKLKIQKDNDTDKFVIIFRLPNHCWPIKVQISPQWMLEFAEDAQIGATIEKPDYYAYTALQKYLM